MSLLFFVQVYENNHTLVRQSGGSDIQIPEITPSAKALFRIYITAFCSHIVSAPC
jgi:hypothetical protein